MHFENPEDGFGMQQAVLEAVGAGTLNEGAMLVWSSSPYTALTRLETRLPGFGRAVSGSEELGFPVMVRNSGGGAVAANEGSVSFSLTFPVDGMHSGLYERYDEGVELVAAAMRRLGVAGAEGGEVTGEFCPGAYSVRSGGDGGVKHAGLAQRVTKRAARIEALILAEKTASLVPVLETVYAALGKPFRAGCIGDVASREDVVDALVREVGARYDLEEIPVVEEMSRRAEEQRGLWRVEGSGGAKSLRS